MRSPAPATKALVKIDPLRAGEPLMEALKKTRSEAVQEAIAGRLGDTGDPRAVQPLLDLLDNEHGKKVREPRQDHSSSCTAPMRSVQPKNN